jgi:hypothetical protein
VAGKQSLRNTADTSCKENLSADTTLSPQWLSRDNLFINDPDVLILFYPEGLSLPGIWYRLLCLLNIVRTVCCAVYRTYVSKLFNYPQIRLKFKCLNR